MNPMLIRGFILAAEIAIFLVVTVAGANFLSHAVAVHFAESDPPSPKFPVLVFEGDPGRPEARQYSVMAWSEWETSAGKRPGASLLLPERSATVRIGDAGEATFTVTAEGKSRQSVALTWRTGGGEQHARYVAEARSIEPRYLRTLGTDTFLMSVIAGFLAGLFAGRALRRRWLPRPGTIVSPPSR